MYYLTTLLIFGGCVETDWNIYDMCSVRVEYRQSNGA